MEESNLKALNLGWKEVKTLISRSEKQISALEEEKEHYEETLQKLKCIGESCGYVFCENVDEWILKECESK